MAPLLREYLLTVLLPIWMAAGFGDYLAHRRSGIERSSGVGESALHLLMLVQIGLPLLLALFLEITTLLFVIFIVALVGHALTGHWDLRYATPRREITPFEQHCHAVMEVFPFIAVSLLAILHWHAFAALWGQGSPDWSLRWKEPPLPMSQRFGILAAAVLLVIVPFGEEFRRCWRARLSAGGHMFRR